MPRVLESAYAPQTRHQVTVLDANRLCVSICTSARLAGGWTSTCSSPRMAEMRAPAALPLLDLERERSDCRGRTSTARCQGRVPVDTWPASDRGARLTSSRSDAPGEVAASPAPPLALDSRMAATRALTAALPPMRILAAASEATLSLQRRGVGSDVSSAPTASARANAPQRSSRMGALAALPRPPILSPISMVEQEPGAETLEPLRPPKAEPIKRPSLDAGVFGASRTRILFPPAAAQALAWSSSCSKFPRLAKAAPCSPARWIAPPIRPS